MTASHTPRNLPAAKRLQDLERPALHLSGVVVHGLQEQYHLSAANQKKDPNTESELILKGMEAIAQQCWDAGRALPKHIYIQADNCPREMKNQFTLLFGTSLLLIADPLESITFNYLQVGHTHEDIGAPSMLDRRRPHRPAESSSVCNTNPWQISCSRRSPASWPSSNSCQHWHHLGKRFGQGCTNLGGKIINCTYQSWNLLGIGRRGLRRWRQHYEAMPCIVCV